MIEDAHESGQELVCVIDDDEDIRAALGSLLRAAGYQTRTFASPEEFLSCGREAACLVLDVHLKDADGLAFQQELLESEATVPVVLMTGYGDIPMSVRAMKAGAINFLTKPFSDADMIAAVGEAVARTARDRQQAHAQDDARALFERLTAREREVLSLVTAGLMNKQVAARLGVSEVTVKIHRGNLMRKMQAQSLADLVRMAEALGVRETSVSRYPRRG
jgi:FixJ family two-component response regulator